MKNICLASIPAPWFFGPYAKQLYMLADQFIKMNKNYTLYYLCLGFDMKQKIYTYTEILENFDDDHTNKKSTNATNLINKKETLEKIKFIGGIEKINGGYTVSSFNKVMSYFNIDCLITCMDLVTLINDEIFKIKSLTWFPNHFQPIRSFDISKLQLFSHIISLCPTDTKLIKKTFPKKKVVYIPHIIDFQVSSEEIDKYKLRIKYNIPLDAFIVLINAGNYELQNRKSFDTSIFAFEQLFHKRRNAFLYIHSFNPKSFNDKNNFISSTGTMFNLKDLISQTEIPANRVKINEELLSDNEIIELMQFSDVLLQSSKAEGFGVPMLEAQLVGLPVITTKFGAMDDYTFYGISVEPLQKMYEPTACGIWAMPSIDGICNALLRVANYEIEDKKEYAKKTIIELMSIEAVSNAFMKIIDEPFDVNEHNMISLSSPNFIPISHIIYDNKSNSFYIDQEKCSNIDTNKLNKEWVLFTDNKVSVNFDLVQNIMLNMKPDEPTNLILFKTSFNNDKNIYPLVEDINANNPNIDFNKMYYCIKKTFFNSFINNVTIENKYMREFILKYAVNTCKVSLAEPIVLKEISSNKDNNDNNDNNDNKEIKGLKDFNNDVNENLVIEISNGMEENIMKYSEFFGDRKSTFEKVYTMILNNINKSSSTYNMIELGTSRSFISNRIDTNTNSWTPNNPNNWAWSDGIFTKVFSENLKNKNFKLFTIDPSKDALNVSKYMIDNNLVNNKVFFIEKYSTDFLRNVDFKIDFLYMDHMESSEEACLKHLEDIKFIIENNLMNKNGIILIDDVNSSNKLNINKSKYSIPYLLDNGYTMVLQEYQAILVKNENSVIEISNGIHF